MAGAEIEVARLETENSDLSQQLETRKLVERAKGILQRDLGIDGGAGVSQHSAPEPSKAQNHEGNCRSNRAQRRSKEQFPFAIGIRSAKNEKSAGRKSRASV